MSKIATCFQIKIAAMTIRANIWHTLDAGIKSHQWLYLYVEQKGSAVGSEVVCFCVGILIPACGELVRSLTEFYWIPTMQEEHSVLTGLQIVL